ncbi:uncharacterized protein LOC101863438 [Aplysia californica]|uniref:Uncharacterized protein LOC101863438 n=1 Tax=Aplysia californica TaxID=6500 RepID=A0ABM0JQP1_APLCA|nr:uncharacterized protein LOC101863438 [Aplysia californica]
MMRVCSLVSLGVLLCVLMTSEGLAVGQINLLPDSWNSGAMGGRNQPHTETTTARPARDCEAYLVNDNPDCFFDTSSCTMMCNLPQHRQAIAWARRNEVAENRPKSSVP